VYKECMKNMGDVIYFWFILVQVLEFLFYMQVRISVFCHAVFLQVIVCSVFRSRKINIVTHNFLRKAFLLDLICKSTKLREENPSLNCLTFFDVNASILKGH
jgi:hypothetical protein